MRYETQKIVSKHKMILTYTLSGKVNPKTLKQVINGTRGCVAEIYRIIKNGGRFAYALGYLTAMPYDYACKVLPDGRVEVSYDFWLVDSEVASTFIKYLHLKKREGMARVRAKEVQLEHDTHEGNTESTRVAADRDTDHICILTHDDAKLLARNDAVASPAGALDRSAGAVVPREE